MTAVLVAVCFNLSEIEKLCQRAGTRTRLLKYDIGPGLLEQKLHIAFWQM